MSKTDLQGTFGEIWGRMADPTVGMEDSFGFVVRRTLMRPRDLLRFLQRAVETAVNRGHQRIHSADFVTAEKVSSEDLLVSLSFELTDTDRTLENVLYHFIDCKSEMVREEVRLILFVAGVDEDRLETVIKLLVWFGFLGVSSSAGEDAVYAYQIHYNVTKLMTTLDSQPAARFVIHPGFRAALGSAS